jgi:hypothetical protein
MRRNWPGAEVIAVAVFGCAAALVLGAAMATHRSTLVIGGLGALTVGGFVMLLYARDPIQAFLWLWLFEIFDSPVSATAGYFSPTGEAIRQGDELLVLLLVCLTIRRAARSDTRMPPLWVVLPALGFAVCGLLSAAFHDVSLTVVLVGSWLALKLWVILIVTFLLPWKTTDMARVYRMITRVGVFVAVLGVADYLTHAAISTALHTSIYKFQSNTERGEAVHSIFPHPGEFSLFMSLLFALTFARFSTTRSRTDLVLALCYAGSVMLSLRLKGFLSLVAVVMIVAVVQGLVSNRGAAALVLIGALLIVGVYSIEGSIITEQISTYTSSESSARARLYDTGAEIASKDFPLGAGFGRFATYASRLYYSPVYQQFNLNNIWGLSRKYSQFIDDTSWPGVIGETGYGGLVIYLLGLVALVFALIKRMRASNAALRWIPLAGLCAVAVLLADSLGDPTLFDWLAVTSFALILGPALVATRPEP